MLNIDSHFSKCDFYTKLFINVINQLKYAAGKSGFVFCEYWELKCVGSGPIVTRGTVLGYPKCLSRSKSHGIRATLSCFIWNKLSYPIAKSWTLVQWGCKNCGIDHGPSDIFWILYSTGSLPASDWLSLLLSSQEVLPQSFLVSRPLVLN